MSDRIFLDTNILVYGAISIDETRKMEVAKQLFRQNPFISPQIVFEFINVARKKFKYTSEGYLSLVRSLLTFTQVIEENSLVVENALVLIGRYSLQPFDSKIVATALFHGCDILYSEDMQHGLIVEDKLKIINPFLDK